MSDKPPADPMTAERIQELLDRSPFSRFFGIRVAAIDILAATIVLAMELRPELERREGSGQWHGGALASLIDTAGDFALVLGLGTPVPTINFRVDYLRPAIDTALIVTATVRRNGRLVGIVDVDVANEAGQLVAIGRATYATAT